MLNQELPVASLNQGEGMLEVPNKDPRKSISALPPLKEEQRALKQQNQETQIVPSPSPTKAEFSPTKAEPEQKEKPKKVSFYQMLRFADKTDWTLMICGGVAACVNGVTLPLFALIFGQLADTFGPNTPPDEIVSEAGKYCLYFVYIGIASFFLSWIQLGCWMVIGERMSIKYREIYFKAIINQDIGWFDMLNPNELATNVQIECQHIKGALGEKVPTFLMSIFMCIGGFVIGYVKGWQLALVATAALPVLSAGAVAYAFVLSNMTKHISESYSVAGGLAEQSLNSVKTVKSLTGEDYELKNYSIELVKAFKVACKFGYWAGLSIGLTVTAMFCDYALSFWFGSKLVHDETYNNVYGRDYTAGDVLGTFTSILIGGFSIGQIGPSLKNFASGQEAAAKIFAILDRVPSILMPNNPQKIDNIQGKVEFKNVHFNYPAKKDIPVHKGLSLSIKPNKKTALVGESGCGKSTVMQLLLRFYDPDSGSVTVDGKDVRDLDFKWLRNNVGYVGQEPVLFATTIRENLKFGREDATEQEMVEALKKANAWEFVQNLENQLDTFVGNSGGQISGGQKQRICIARAILKNPQILLLDEATSALDRKNEAMLQKTLDEISQGRTTIVIAHRLTTIQNADEILVLDKGQLKEIGTFDELIKLDGKFAILAKNQIEKEQQEKQEKGSNENLDEEKPQEDIVRKVSVKQQKANQVGTEQINQNQNVDEIKQKVEDKGKVQFGRLFALNKPERPFFYTGVVFSLANGVLFPLSGLILGEFIEVLGKPEASDFQDKASLLAIYYVILAACSQFFITFKIALFTRAAEGLTFRVRSSLLNKMLKMPGSWFDYPKNNPGVLSSRLATDAHLINSLTSSVLAIQIENVSSLITGLVIAFTASWRVSLIALAVFPLIVISGTIQAKSMEGFSAGSDEAYKNSGKIIMESVTNIRTVASFSNEKKLQEILKSTLLSPFKQAFKQGNISGLSLGFSQLSLFAVQAIIFICSAVFMRDYGMTARDMFVSMFSILNAAQAIGNNNHFMGDVGQARNACREIFKILDSEDELQIQEKRGSKLLGDRVSGNIEFKNVCFKYPTRDAQVLHNLNLTIKAGQKVAFVGPSGSGKSSILQLLLRYYDDYEGEILVDGQDLRSYDVREFRKSFGVVSQEPILFNGTIYENIKYNTENIGFPEIKEAAVQANALKFIEDDEKELNKAAINTIITGRGFEKKVGSKGSQLSGGQKQRIAIARAIIKNPNILLLDEATSALDHENEKIVQEALNQVMKGKTSLCVAHRLSTIKDSDQIFVIESGNLVEQGTYEELMSRKSFFYRLNNL